MSGQDLKKNPRLWMQGALHSVILAPGALMGLDTVEDCMKDETLRPFMGQALLREIMPSMGLGREVLDPLAMAVCHEMEAPSVTQPLALLINNGVRSWADQALPLLISYQEREDALPPCLCMSLSTLIMLFASVKRREDGTYACLKNGEDCSVTEDEDILSSFARMNCDMPPEALSYAVLSDRAIWDRDLRDIPGLEDKITDQLRDLQLLGLTAALEKARNETN